MSSIKPSNGKKPSDGRLTIRQPQHGERCAAVVVKAFAELAYITRDEPPRVQFLGYPWLSAAELREIADALDARACAKIE